MRRHEDGSGTRARVRKHDDGGPEIGNLELERAMRGIVFRWGDVPLAGCERRRFGRRVVSAFLRLGVV
jgi:hypothetical protein